MINQIPNPLGPDSPIFRPRVQWRPEWAELNRLWWKRPETVRILFYMDGASFDGGSFYGLQHAVTAIQSDPWPWAKFVVTTANRYMDAAADHDNVNITDLDLDNYDEVWLFGISSNANLLSAAEATALEAFMDNGGGVLTTGDHASLGRGLSGPLKRVGKLRMYPAPLASAPDWNTTIRDANADGNYAFNEQSDATPQNIRPVYRYHWSYSGSSGSLRLQKSPHPLLCSEEGIVSRLPDHQHEGQVVIPDSFPTTEWPMFGAYQATPEVVAWGRIIDPAASNAGQEFPVIGAYDGHRVNVGRIVADSTWHHWFDINMDGFDINSDDYRQITSYFQNVAAWLAPKAKQNGMRNGVFWLALHENVIFEHDLSRLAVQTIAPIVRDALGRWAPQCLVSGWLFELLPLELANTAFAFDADGPKMRRAIEDEILAETFKDLRDHFDIASGRLEPAKSFDLIDRVVVEAPERMFDRLMNESEAELKALRDMADSIASRRLEVVGGRR